MPPLSLASGRPNMYPATRAQPAGPAGPSRHDSGAGQYRACPATVLSPGVDEPMLKTAIVGMKPIGNQHADCHVTSPHAQLVAVCDMDRDLADAGASKYGVKAYYDLDAMLAEEELDVIDVCTGGHEKGCAHHGPVMTAIAAGKAVLCEKPISNDIGQAREMVAAAKEAKVPFGINLNYRFTPLARKAKQWVDEGRLGELNFLNKALWIGGPDATEFIHMRALHPHSVDVMRFLCGNVAQVHAYLKKSGDRQCWSNCQVGMRFRNGVIGNLTGSYDMCYQHPIERTELAGTKGRLVLENVYVDLWFYPHDSDEVTHIHNSIFGGVKDFNDTFTARIHRFMEQVANGDCPDAIEASGYDGLQAQEVIEAAIRSHQTGQAVDVPE